MFLHALMDWAGGLLFFNDFPIYYWMIFQSSALFGARASLWKSSIEIGTKTKNRGGEREKYKSVHFTFNSTFYSIARALSVLIPEGRNVSAHFLSKVDLCGQLNTTGFSCLMPPSCLPSFPYPKPLMFKDKHLSFYPHPISGRSLRFLKRYPCLPATLYERILTSFQLYID